MPSSFSIKLGDFLYKNAFPVYNIIYPFFKRRQDKHDIALMQQHIKQGDIVLDIGANIGFYTKILSQLVGDEGKVYAFEPDNTNFGHLMRNAGHLKNVEFHNKAVSDKTGTITLYHSDMLNVDHKTYATENYTSKSEIPCVAMDDIIPEQKVDFIKIDIQGFEYFAFKGMQQIFNKNKSLKIITEFYPLGLQNANIDATELSNFLWQHGFIISKTENDFTSEFTASDIAKYTAVKDEYTFVDLFIEKKQ
ncbi:MAG: FkbM family methyltransferase [Chitinophagales bacterium]|jgi:FkbM family methyltransferase